MEINTIRKIDYWFGIPICFLLSLIERVNGIFNIKKNNQDIPNKILFLELSEMGSVILAYPAMKKARRLYSNAELYFWTFRQNSEAVEILKIIPKENIITMRSHKIIQLFIDVIKNIRFIRRKKIEMVVDMELFSRFSSILSYLTGAKSRAGFFRYSLEGLYRGNLHTHKVQYKSYIHISKNFLNLVESFFSLPQEAPLLKRQCEYAEFYLPKVNTIEKEERIWNKLRKENDAITKSCKIIIINPGFNDRLHIRRWPLENYVELTERLTKKPDIFVVLIGLGSNEADNFSHLKRCINFVGNTDIKELISLFNISGIFVSNDGGIVHLASLTKIYIIVLFGPETPLLYAPLTQNKDVIYKDFACSPCLTAYNHRQSTCKNNKCMQTISVEEVYALTKRFYNEFSK